MGIESFIHYMKEMGSHVFGGLQGRQNAQQIAFLRQLQKDIKKDEMMNRPLRDVNVTVIDIETTGFFPEQGDQMISIGAVKLKGNKIDESQHFYSLIHIDQELPSEIVELTGIQSSELQNAPLLSEVLIQFFQFVKDDILVAHHSNHEKTFLQHASWNWFRTPFKHRIVDTSFLFKIAEPELELIRLEDWCEHAQIEVVNRHHALGDAFLTAKLWRNYIEKVESLGVVSLMNLYEQLAKK